MTEAEQPVFDLQAVKKTYDTGGGRTVEVLTDINFKVVPGEALSIVGASGSGKSTLLNILGTLDRPSSGKMLLDGEDTGALDEAALAKARNRKIGFIFQMHHLLPQCTILENVLIPTLINRTDDNAVQRAEKLLERIGLADRISHRPAQLSGGECQRVAVVRSLINRPRVVLADEPTGSLDRKASDNLAELLLELNREEHVTLITVTHDRELAARMPRKLTLFDGKLKEDEQ